MGPPGRLIASGRAADVYDLGDGSVLRRYRIDHDTLDEARLMEWVAGHGIAVPGVRRAEGSDLVMDRIDGPTMLEDLLRRPWRLLRHASTLARLQRRIGALRAPEWLAPSADGPDGSSVLHLDLHPMNVLLSDTGPVVIDWTNAARGPAALDAAYTYVLMSTFEAATRREQLGRRLMSDTFARRRGRDEVRQCLGAACERRLRDRATTPAERLAVRRLLATVADG